MTLLFGKHKKTSKSFRRDYTVKTGFRRLVCLFIVSGLLLIPTQAFAQPDLPFEITAKAAILVDYETNTILFEKSSNEKLPIASVTKIMTILLALESIEAGELKLDDIVEVSKTAASVKGSTAFLSPGEQFPVSTLLEAIIVASANDASVAIAEKISGSQELFVKKMNEKAHSLGMNNSNFMNCTGLPEENHYSSAQDVVIMSRELLKYPLFFKWSTIWLDYMRDGETMLNNTNKLIRFYDGCDGVKTGYTTEALHCISATAKRDNLRLISVILGAPDSKARFREASKLMDYGFANYESVPIIKKGQVIKQAKDIPVTDGKFTIISGIASNDLSVLLQKGSPKDFNFSSEIDMPLKAPIKEGQKIGYLKVELNGHQIGNVDILADRSIESANILDYFNKILNRWLKPQHSE